MKPIHFEFIEDRRWRLVWAIALVLAVVIVSAALLHWRKLRLVDGTVHQQITALVAKERRAEMPLPTQSMPRLGNASQAARLLQFDMNKIFASIENLQLTGVKVRGVTFDASSELVNLEMEVSNMSSVPSVTDALNAGYQQPPWRLVQLIRSNDGNESPSAPARYLGYWAAPAGLL